MQMDDVHIQEHQEQDIQGNAEFAVVPQVIDSSESDDDGARSPCLPIYDADTGMATQTDELSWDDIAVDEGELNQSLPPEEIIERGMKWYDERKNTPLFPGCKLTVLQVAYSLLSLKLRFHVTDVAMDQLCALLAYALCPNGNCMPHNMYAIRKLCQVESSSGITYHCCEDDHYVWDFLPRCEWSKHYRDICPIPNCGKRRFHEQKGPNGSSFTPAKVIYYFGLKRCIEYLHSLPWWNEAREKVDRDVNTTQCNTIFGSRKSKELYRHFGETLLDIRVGLYELGVDWFSFFADKRQRITTGVIGMKGLDLPDTDKEKRAGHVTLMVMPGPNQPKSVQAYMALIVKDFQHLMATGGAIVQKAMLNIGAMGVDVVCSKAVRHLPILASVVGDNPARQKVAEFRGHGAIRACPYCWMSGKHNGAKTVYLGYSTDEMINPSDVPTRHLQAPLRVRVGDRRAQKSCDEMVRAGTMVRDGHWDPNLAGCNGLSSVAELSYVNYKDVWRLGFVHIILLGLIQNFIDRILPRKVQDLPAYAVQQADRGIVKQCCAQFSMPIGQQKPLCIVTQRGNFDMSMWWLHTK